jgi:hypothetical protein
MAPPSKKIRENIRKKEKIGKFWTIFLKKLYIKNLKVNFKKVCGKRFLKNVLGKT